ncbi:MAG: SDR family oxidoreductase [Gammaproteobacteria bacterium]|nr:SDR family oxidoreductase [Gammaproteobacteria bacterium]NCW09396.1 SDR family oxidoreductase [Gammaproteobacteria bacterium]NCW74001.1 SDR family oxidoreductase [Gammaproteobacteria bacterium]NCX49463.1 SDR family oxidoreductase [Gammaproteobacteria bacterium]
MMKNLDGRVVIVTGGSGGIGIVASELMANRGAHVVLAELDGDRAEIEAKRLSNQGLKVSAIQTDVANKQSVQAMVQKVTDQVGRIDGLVNNAAMFSRVPMSRVGSLEIPEAEWDKMMEINVKGVWNVCSAVAPVMKAQNYGKIVNISSGTALKGSPSRIHYVTSKAAVIGYTKSLAMEVGEHNVYVNCIAPGSTLAEENPTPEIIAVREKAATSRCIKRVQTPEDLAGPIAFFIGPDSDFITGQTLVVDGGSCLH